ncbi:hypothetical protein [Yoonia sp. 208BN28-4]|uniref:hypothetical protein n=1 Tax=Yoonia sp. 208BN28-4 TaxID=3126505 RepID=UPI0030B0FF74
MTAQQSQTAAPDRDGTAAKCENNRDRVRRILFDHLGFRHPRGTDPAEGRKALDAIADELAYVDDKRLGVLARMLLVHGQGSAKNFWPDRATFLNFAHIVQPRPLTDDPKLLGWFGSVEGPKAIARGTLVETFQYFQAKRVPPVTDGAMRLVEGKAADNQSRAARIAERLGNGLPVSPDDQQWHRYYTDLLSKLTQLVEVERTKRGKAVA